MLPPGRLILDTSPYPYLLRGLDDHAAQPGVGDGHYLHPDGARLRLSRRGARLVQPPRPGVAAVDTMEAAFCVETLEDALARYGKPEIFNTDQGSQFTGAAFTGVLANNGIAISMDGKGAWRDNVFVERLWRSVKYEEVYLRAYDSVGEARASIGRYSTSTMADDRIRALTARHPIKPTSPRCPSAWQPNPGRRSTYRCGKSVQTTGTTSCWYRSII